ncbi:MAG TPA: PPC domain-containing protein, partial [Tepidisphaeraceae bacterium]|nr:PPC domain-containing protein [Tepidisphaeraceae bacterium]
MGPSRGYAIGGLLLLLSLASVVTAQQPNPHIGYVYPAGGQRGESFQVTVGGQFLDGVSDARISGTGAQAAIIKHTKPLTNQQASQLRDKLKELLARKSSSTTKPASSQPTTQPAWTAEDDKAIAEIREQLAAYQNRSTNPALAETVTVQITLTPAAKLGEQELRLKTPAGWSNPLVFCIGQLSEFREEPASNKASPTETSITLPSVVNGQIMPGQVDRFRFQAQRGQRLVVVASARQLMPYLADAVPGWFQATLALYDAQGKEVAYADDYRFNPDPVLCYQIPQTGPYVIAIKDSIYRGREDFVYRLTLGELPFVTSIFPLGGRIGDQTNVTLQGWNLPVTQLTQDAKGKAPGIYSLSINRGKPPFNRVPFALDALPESLDQEPNNQVDGAQSLTPPVIVNGRIGEPGDWDIFRFQGRAGQRLVAEVFARRLGSPLDSVLKLTDAAGQQLAFNDDHEDKGSGLSTHHADSYLSTTLPTDGTYYLHLGDAQHKGGKEYAYRLRLSPPRPDYELRLVPSTLSIRNGGSAVLTAY